MIICKNLNKNDTISTLLEWFDKCPPQGKKLHWVDGRSAKETAKHWLSFIPVGFTNLLYPFQLSYQICSPEFITYFDNLTGNGRNHDLLIIAKNCAEEKVVISIESKVDETFRESVSIYLSKVLTKKGKGQSSNADIRINSLLKALFINQKKLRNDRLMYQLLTGVAGTLAEAQKQNAKTAIFLVQTFKSFHMDSVKHRKNQRDLDCFLDATSNGKYKIIHDGDLLGPFRVQGNTYIPGNIDLWIGKYSIKL